MKKPQPWGYVALCEYTVPSAPLTEAAHKGLKRLWRRLWPRGADASDGPSAVGQKSSVEFFDGLFAQPDWEAAAPQLIALADEKLSGGQTTQVFVGGPHRCTSEMLRHLARARRWPVIESPTPKEILEQRFDPPNIKTGSVVVIPQLAHWFLRHDDGLDVIRNLIDRLQSTRQPVLLGCHSWAWSYLDKAIQISTALPEPRVLAPLDAAALQQWLQEMAVGAGTGKTVFREASSGKIVLALGGSTLNVAPTPADGDRSSLLTHIAAHGRGLPEITWSMWREAILRFDQKMMTEDALKMVSDKDERTVWVPSWGQLKLPDIQQKPGHLQLFLMHSLLLHAGLPEEVLPRLLPFPRAEILRGLRDLHARGVVEPDEDRWRVSPAAYPSVRSVLNDECYLVDNL